MEIWTWEIEIEYKKKIQVLQIFQKLFHIHVVISWSAFNIDRYIDWTSSKMNIDAIFSTISSIIRH